MAEIAVDELKRRLKTQRMGARLPLAEMRAALDSAGDRVRPDPAISVIPAHAGSCAAERLKPDTAQPGAIVLYLHGGGFVGGSCSSHRPLATAMAKASNLETLNLEYRLAPEHPWPAAEDDAFEAYLELQQKGVKRVAIVGDSAGGNLAMTTLLRAKAGNVALPRVCVLMSPWLDLDLQGHSITALAAEDPILSAEALSQCAAQYRRGCPGPNILGADLRGLPPMLVQSGGSEILRDDSIRLAEALAAAGVPAKLDIQPGLFHVWQAYYPWLQEARDAIAQIGSFLHDHMVQETS